MSFFIICFIILNIPVIILGISMFIDIFSNSNIHSLSSDQLENREETCYNDDNEV